MRTKTELERASHPIFLLVLFQAKAIIILPHDLVAAHDTKTGELLWKHQIEDEEGVRHNSFLPFITKDISGYVIDRQIAEGNKVLTIHLFATQGGAAITTIDVPCKAWIRSNSMQSGGLFCKGPFLAYTDRVGHVVHVIRVKGKEVERHEFPFPVDRFEQTEAINEDPSHDLSLFKLIGFVGNTVLIGNIGSRSAFKTFLFSFDLESALEARNQSEKDSAFNLPLESSSSTVGDLLFSYQPIYKTDRTDERVNIVGVMREKITDDYEDVVTVDNCFFVNQMQYSKDF